MITLNEIARQPERMAELSIPAVRAVMFQGLAIAAAAAARLAEDPSPAAAPSESGGRLAVTLTEAAEILGVSEQHLRDHRAEYGGYKSGKLLMFSLKRIQDEIRRKAMR